MKTRFIIAFAAASILAGTVRAQVETTQYFMMSLPQVVDNNPAFVPKYKFALGLPGSQIGLGYYNNGFNYNDLTKKENGVRVVDFPKWIKVLPEKTYITTTAQVDLFRFGLRMGPKLYLSINSSLKGYSRFMMPKDIAALAVEGNANYMGTTASISPKGEMTTYLENAVGLSISPINNLRVGARVKMLKGFVNAHTEMMNATLSVSDNYEMTVAAGMDVRTSGVQNFGDQSFSLSNYAGNNGFAVDLGATYKLDKLTLAASLVDLGAIKWKSNTYQYTLDPTKATYTFKGIDVTQLTNGNTDYATAISDSLQAKFKAEEKAGAAYSVGLPAKMYLSASYEVMKNLSVAALFHSETFQGRVASGLSFAMNKNFGKVISTTLSYSVNNRSFNNLGAGLSFNLAPVQLYIVGDNLLRLPLSVATHGNVNEFLNNSKVVNFRMGLNFVWGWTTEGKEKETKSYNKGKKKK